MTLSNIKASFSVQANLYNGQEGINGQIQIQTSQSLDGLGLDALYSVVIPAATLVAVGSGGYNYTGFPNVLLNSAVLYGDDKLPLVLPVINGYSIQIIEDTNDATVAAGSITATITRIGNALATPAVHSLVTGDCLTCLTSKGWTSHTNSVVKIVANTATTLANCNVVFTLFGKTTGSGSGYYA